ncbi:hypothetical protein [Fusibacter sp. JL216-2]|uniref:hypothetical protein n=1 Tax=Fusibacter sp. JL216-2 TaxID=3071453 RepID=UPI003D3310AD
MAKLLNMLLGWEEVYMSTKVDHYSKAKLTLINNGIKTRTETNGTSTSAFQGNFASPYSGHTMYYLFVKRKDYDKAKGLLSG